MPSKASTKPVGFIIYIYIYNRYNNNIYIYNIIYILFNSVNSEERDWLGGWDFCWVARWPHLQCATWPIWSEIPLAVEASPLVGGSSARGARHGPEKLDASSCVNYPNDIH